MYWVGAPDQARRGVEEAGQGAGNPTWGGLCLDNSECYNPLPSPPAFTEAWAGQGGEEET